LWWDRRGDCDCFTVFICSVLQNLGIKTLLRITRYKKDYFQHIYPVAFVNGKEVIMDAVADWFNYEVPYSEKKDYAMQLDFLDGLDDADMNSDLGRFEKLKNAIKKTGKISGKAVHAVNKFNPGTAAMRLGILTAMKTNVLNVAGRLKWAFLDDNMARQKGFNMQRLAQYREVLSKLGKAFYAAGGDRDNLKQAILTGKGNAGKEVSGFGNYPAYDPFNANQKARMLLGEDVWKSEFSGLGELGEPVSAATLGAAMTVITTIAAALKKIGALKDGEPNSEDPNTSSPVLNTVDVTDGENAAGGSKSLTTKNTDENNASTDENANRDDSAKGFDKVKGWVKENPLLTAAGVLAVGTASYFGIKAIQKKKKEANQSQKMQGQTSGIPYGKMRKRRKRKQKNKPKILRINI
jgi:hypothetical protein